MLQGRPQTVHSLLFTSPSTHCSCLRTHITPICDSPAIEKLAYATIKVYMAAVRSVHVNTGNHVIFDKQLTPLPGSTYERHPHRVVQDHPTKSTSPITMEIMERIKAVLSKTPKDYQCIMLWAVCCTAFFGLLCISKFTVPSLC